MGLKEGILTILGLEPEVDNLCADKEKLYADYKSTKKFQGILDGHMTELKPLMFKVAEIEGVLDEEKGHISVVIGNGGFQKQARYATPKLNEQRVIDMISAKGLDGVLVKRTKLKAEEQEVVKFLQEKGATEFLEVVEEIDKEELEMCFNSKILSEDEYLSLFDNTKPTYALIDLEKEKKPKG